MKRGTMKYALLYGVLLGLLLGILGCSAGRPEYSGDPRQEEVYQEIKRECKEAVREAMPMAPIPAHGGLRERQRAVQALGEWEDMRDRAVRRCLHIELTRRGM